MRTIVLLCGFVVALLVAEAICKVVDLCTAKKDHMVRDRVSRRSNIPGVRYELVPGIESTTPGQKQIVRVNQHGFRGPEIAERKPSNGYRVAILGDSISFGRTYAEDEIYASLFQDKLAAAHPDRVVEVINASLSGRDTWEERAVLEHRVFQLQPDAVVLQVCMNDHTRLPLLDKEGHIGMFGELPWYGYSSLLGLLDRKVPGFRNRHVAGLDALGLDARTPDQRLQDQFIRPEDMLAVTAHWPAWRDELLALVALCRDRNLPVLFLVFPLSHQLGSSEDVTSAELAALAAEENIPYLDMLPFFRRYGERAHRDPIHPSRFGHRIVAGELARVFSLLEEHEIREAGIAADYEM